MKPVATQPAHESYDVVIAGGAIMGSSVAFHLLREGFQGRILVVERDPSYAHCSTAHTNSCMRQQFSHPLNVRISQDTARYVQAFRDELGDERVPDIHTHLFGYLYLAADRARVAALESDQSMQARLGTATTMMSCGQMQDAWPFLNLDGILAGSHNPVDEGYFDGGAMFQWWRRLARERGAEYVTAEVAALECKGNRVTHAVLGDGTRIACGVLVNAAGPRAARIAAMAGIDLPVEPRKRFTWVVEAAAPLDRALPLLVDPSGVHMHSDGSNYMIGAKPVQDGPVSAEDFSEDPDLWLGRVWPIVAHRIPQFDRLKVINSWAGHYAFNTHDQNAIVGPHPDIGNFLFINGFSGHGLQQSPAMGRGVAEWICHGSYQKLDLTPFGFERLDGTGGIQERAVI